MPYATGLKRASAYRRRPNGNGLPWAEKNYRWAGTDTKSELKNYAWYKNDDGGDANGKTHQVKLKSANGYGLYDMSGNVWEWCWDWYSSTTPTGGQDPAGAASGVDRVPRGGSWGNDAVGAARASRGNLGPDDRVDYVGLRLVSRP